MDPDPCRPGAPDPPLYRLTVRAGGGVLFRLTAEGVRERDELIARFKCHFPAPGFSVAVEEASWRTLGGW